MKRLLTAAVLLPILMYAVWSTAPYLFIFLAAIAALIALSEFYDLATRVQTAPHRFVGYGSTLAVIGCFALDRMDWLVAAITAACLLSLAQSLARTREMSTALASASITVFGTIYIGVLLGFLVGVRATSSTGSKLLTMFFAMVMLADTGAYYVGRAFGRHKLAPPISPGKTVEGSIAGLLCATAVGPLSTLVFFPEMPILHSVLLGAAIGVIGQIGDLAESILKRGSDVKDSSRLLPGHGGMLDRLDSILFCAPLLFYYSRFFRS